ncbi:TRAP transporter small permease [Pseudothauera rhizosphaerae]|uniref:TRAP transporter small permease protein n=1 Tax=Pseudothauera rhizosphaerae TaxID=2565932 RepID=A0A4S4AIM4_9RHOO|nr:TRAP transporter small permease [Pseudothauera rhizosphaerae]THF59214.1 TRAP transporter small permease [Pseudothauera rhizosphaerae]
MKILDHIEEWLITFLMGAATLIIFVSVAHRYGTGIDYPPLQDALLSINMGWAQELTIIMFVWMAKFGAAYGVRTGIHVGVDVLINRLSTQNRGRFIIFGLGAGALFTGIVGTLGLTFVLENGAHYQILSWLGLDTGDLYEGPVTPDLEWPTWMVYSAVPLGSYLMCFRFLQVMVSFIRTGELPHHDHGHVDGIDEEHLPVDANPYDMGDDLHPHDLKHKQIGEEGPEGRDAGKGDKQ